MLYASFATTTKRPFWSRSKTEDDACMVALAVVERKLAGEAGWGQCRLLPTTAGPPCARRQAPGPSTAVRRNQGAAARFFVVDCTDLDHAIETARSCPAQSGHRRPMRSGRWPSSGRGPPRRERHRLDRRGSCSAAPGAGALLRYFRDLDAAEEAFQNGLPAGAKAWPQNGPPREPGRLADHGRRNAGIDRGPARTPADAASATRPFSDLGDAERRWPSGWTGRTYRTTSCGCCSSAAIPVWPGRRSRSPCASSAASPSGRIGAPPHRRERHGQHASTGQAPAHPVPAADVSDDRGLGVDGSRARACAQQLAQ